MKIGIIIIFNNHMDEIDTEVISKSLKTSDDIVLCLVDNQSKDKTLEMLIEIKESVKNVEVVEIKKECSFEAAKRAGARFMYNNYNLNHIGFIDVNSTEYNDLNICKVIELVCNRKDVIVTLKKELKENSARFTLFKSIFSVLEVLKHRNFMSSLDKTFLSIN